LRLPFLDSKTRFELGILFMSASFQQIPEVGYLRLSQIIGNPKANPPFPALIPVSKSTWWLGVKQGRYPKPVKLSARTTAWRVEDIRALIIDIAEG
jgi:hypothetical protein